MDDLAWVLSILLVVRVVIDIMSLKSGGVSYRLELAYFVVFSVGAVILLAHDLACFWSAIAAIIALYSLVQFFAKKARHRQDESSAAT